MSDLAELGLRIRSEEAQVATKRLDDLTTSASKAERATDLLGVSHHKTATAAGELQSGIAKAVEAEQKMIGVTSELSAVQSIASQAMSGHGVAANALRPALVGVVGAMEPMLALLGPLAVGIGALGYLWLDGQKTAGIYESAVTGVGRVAGMTAEELRKLTEANADAGELSIRAAQDMAASYLQTGNVGGAVLGDLLRLTKDYAAFTGTDAPAAQKALADAMADPDKAAHSMTATFGLLTQAQIDQVEAAVLAGNQAGAQAIILGELDKALDTHKKNVSEITSLWEAGARMASNFVTWAGEAAFISQSERLQSLIDKRASMERGLAAQGRTTFGSSYEQGQYDTAGRDAWAIRQERTRQQDAQTQSIARRQAEIDAQLAASRRSTRVATGGASGGATARISTPRPELEYEKFDAAPSYRLNDHLTATLQLRDPLDRVIEDLRTMDDLARDAGQGMAESFGTAGRALSDLLTTATGYQARLAEIDRDRQSGHLDATQAARERSAAEVQSYGDMAAAAKGFFDERSDAYKVLQAAEQAYRAVQFAMAVQAMILDQTESGSAIANAALRMGSEAGETASTVLHAGIRAAAHAAEAVARVFASIPFPFNIAAAGALVAAMAAFGVKAFGGHGGGGGGSSVADSADKAQTSTALQATANSAASNALASKVQVVVTADRDGMNAYVVRTAQTEAANIIAPVAAMTASGTKKDVFQTIENKQAGNRKVVI